MFIFKAHMDSDMELI